MVFKDVCGQNKNFDCRSFVNITECEINVLFQTDSIPEYPIKINIKKLFSLSNRKINQLDLISKTNNSIKYSLDENVLIIDAFQVPKQLIFDTLLLIGEKDTSKIVIRIFSIKTEIKVEDPQIVRGEIMENLKTLTNGHFFVTYTEERPLYRYVYWKSNSKIGEKVLIIGDPEDFNSYSLRKKKCGLK